MKPIDILTAPWAIVPEKLEEIIKIYDAHLHGEKIDIEAAEKNAGKTFDNQQKAYEIIDGVAVFDFEGVIAKRMNMFTQISGGISTQMFADDFKMALADTQVHSILINIDSPGGTVDGVQNLADMIFQSRGQKPIVTVADGIMASGAVWIGSAADKVFIKDNTTMVGSIGVVVKHIDISKAEEIKGIKTTEIYAGKYKRMVSTFKPLSDEGKAYMQEMVDAMYSVFVENIARNRGTDVETVLTKMADGKIFIGKQVIESGLADGIATQEQIISMLNTEKANKNQAKLKTNGGKNMDEDKKLNGDASAPVITAEVIEKEYPAIAQGFIEKGMKTGAESERKRIMDVEAQSITGHEALIASLKFDGKTTGPEAAVQILAAEKKNNGKMLETFKKEAPDAAPLSAHDEGTGNPATSDEEKMKKEWDNDEKLRAEFQNDVKKYEAYEKAMKAKQIKFAPKVEGKKCLNYD